MNKKISIISLGIIIFILASIGVATQIFAEQGSLSPESGSTSRIKILSDTLTTSGYGSASSGSWGDWGSIWNRIYSSAIWTPNTSNNATAADVVSGKKFYAGNNRTEIIGTAAPLDYAAFPLNQSLCFGDSTGSCSSQSVPSQSWTNVTTDVWKDNATGLYWTNSQGNMLNQYTPSQCDFFITLDRGNYSGSDTGTASANCGPANNAINYCATLSFGGRTDWYLPTKAELFQAYYDNINGLTNSTFVAGSYSFWSSSESSVTYGHIFLFSGSYGTGPKNGGYYVRCVARD